jgi:isopentenyl-diphosphate delta-isomerase
MDIRRRKDDHIEISLNKDVMASRNYWDDVHLIHRAIPLSDMEDIDLGIELLGSKLKIPLIIASMTGGSPQAKRYNKMLAKAAEELQIGMGVGSQRAGIENPNHRDSYEVVKEYDIPLILGNLGAPQFSSSSGSDKYDPGKVADAIDMVNAHAICIHLNYLQEVVQPEGDTLVSGLRENLKVIARDFNIIAKETGAGISRPDATELKRIGIKAIDVGGMSGTTFSGVESYRSDPSGRSERMGRTFWDWGIPTPISLLEANVGIPLIGTGGLRNGLDIVKAITMGATAGGMAWKLLKAASKGYEDLIKELNYIEDEIRAGIFLTGKTSTTELMCSNYILTGLTKEMLDWKMNRKSS